MWHPGVSGTARRAGLASTTVCSSPEGGKGSWEVAASLRKTERWLRPAPLFRESQRPVRPQHAAFKPGPSSPRAGRLSIRGPPHGLSAPRGGRSTGGSEEQRLPEPGAPRSGRGANGRSASTPHSRAPPGTTPRGSRLQPSLKLSEPHRQWSGEIARTVPSGPGPLPPLCAGQLRRGPT